MSQLIVALTVTFGAPALKDKPGPEPTLIGEWIPETVTASGRGVRPSSDKWFFGPDGTYAISASGKVLESGSWNAKASPGILDLLEAGGGQPTGLCR